jgi:hypothetical protein
LEIVHVPFQKKNVQQELAARLASEMLREFKVAGIE